MKRAYLILISLTVAVFLLGGVTLLFPSRLLSPGELATVHAELADDCLACHAPLRGLPDQRCRACHPSDGFTTGSEADFHARPETGACVACHPDHHGASASITRAFDHGALPDGPAGACLSCHQAPADDLHATAEADCGACHLVEAWTPAQLDHDAYFRFDRSHPEQCADCHPAELSTYTCYGCHAHSERGVRAEHIEEGIRDFADCVECHRSGDEHDIVGRRGRGERREREHESHEREHDDRDDDD